MSSVVIMGLLGVCVMLFWYGNEFRKSGSNALYYLCFFASLFFLLNTSNATYLMYNYSYSNATSVVSFLENSNVSLFFLVLTLSIIMLLLIVKKYLLTSTEDVSESIRDKRKRLRGEDE